MMELDLKCAEGVVQRWEDLTPKEMEATFNEAASGPRRVAAQVMTPAPLIPRDHRGRSFQISEI
jgi:hypothetical protein